MRNPALGGKFTGEQFNERGLTRAIRPQQADARAGAQGEIHGVKHGATFVSGANAIEHQEWIRRTFGFGKFKIERRIDVRGADALHAIQSLEPALRLARLGRLGAKAFDIFFKVGDFALLLRIHRRLHGEARGALLFERRIVASRERQFLRVQIGDMGDAGIEKIPVMRHQQQGSAITGEPLLKPNHGFQIEVVGGLIEQQQVGTADQRLREIEPHAPAAGKRRHRAFEFSVRKTKAGQQCGGARFGAVAVDLAQPHVQFGEAVAVMINVGSLRKTGKLVLDSAKFGITIEHVFDSGFRTGGRILRDRCGFPACRNITVATVVMQFAAQQRKQAGLATAIGANQTHAPAGMDLQRGVFDQAPRATRQCQIAELNHPEFSKKRAFYQAAESRPAMRCISN